MSLSPEDVTSYTKIIDSILSASDLQTISAKRIRKALQVAVEADITAQKDAINELIEERYELCQQQQRGKKGAEDDASPPSEDGTSPPPKKKAKRAASEDDDAVYAARLQAEENSLARPTRGSATRKQKPAKAAKIATTPSRKKKSAAKVKADDDSDVETGEDGQKKRTGVFHKPFALSEPLAQVVGETQLSRPQVVKKTWEYVRGRELQNPDDKRQIMCDDALRAVFKQDSVHMFTMNKFLSKHLYPVEEE